MRVLEIANVRMGCGFRSKIEHNPEGNVPVIQPKDITNSGLLQVNDINRVKMPTIKPGQVLTKGDVLLTSRGKFASTVYAGKFKENYVAAGSLLVLTVKAKIPILPEYLSLYFNSAKGKLELNRLTECTTIPYLNRSNLEQMDIPIPPLEKQENLVALERIKQRYAQLTHRKVDLLNNVLNHQLI